MSFWLNDHELFLYTKGTGSDDVHLWRCKNSASSSSSGSSLVVPMKSDDFDYVSKVENHLELIAHMSNWEEADYKRLVKYIYEKRLLVNGQGLVIAELPNKVDKDGPAIYIRSLDVLPLNSYIPKLSERPIPLRTVKYLGDVNGKVAMKEEKDSNVTQSTAGVENLEAEITRLESKNNTLDKSVTQLTARVENLEAENTRLESKNNTLDKSVTQLTAGLATKTGNVVDLQSKNKTLEAENKTLDSNAKTLEGKVTRLTADLVRQMNANTKEVWMNDLTNSEWVGVEGLNFAGPFNHVTSVGPQGTYTVDDRSTNVRARYWYKKKIVESPEFRVVCLEDLTPNKERARFSQDKWWSFESKGKTYAYYA